VSEDGLAINRLSERTLLTAKLAGVGIIALIDLGVPIDETNERSRLVDQRALTGPTYFFLVEAAAAAAPALAAAAVAAVAPKPNLTGLGFSDTADLAAAEDDPPSGVELLLLAFLALCSASNLSLSLASSSSRFLSYPSLLTRSSSSNARFCASSKLIGAAAFLAPNLDARRPDDAPPAGALVVEVLEDIRVAPSREGAFVAPPVVVDPPVPALNEEDVTVRGPVAGRAAPIPGSPAAVGFWATGATGLDVVLSHDEKKSSSPPFSPCAIDCPATGVPVLEFTPLPAPEIDLLRSTPSILIPSGNLNSSSRLRFSNSALYRSATEEL
jgi:hypothetical protein